MNTTPLHVGDVVRFTSPYSSDAGAVLKGIVTCVNASTVCVLADGFEYTLSLSDVFK